MARIASNSKYLYLQIFELYAKGICKMGGEGVTMSEDSWGCLGYVALIIIVLLIGYCFSQHGEGWGYEVTHQNGSIEFVESDNVSLEIDKIVFKINNGMLHNQKFVTSFPLGEIIKVIWIYRQRCER